MRTYTLTHAAYGQPAGTSLALDESDPLVKLNVDNGVLIPSYDGPPLDARMTCPICKETMKRPVRVDNADDLAAHYEDKHAGFVIPDWHADTEED